MAQDRNTEESAQFMLMSVFCGHIEQQLSHSISCLRQVQFEHEKGIELHNDTLFFWLDTLLLHTSQLSLAFWPADKNSKKRGEVLRHAYCETDAIDFFRDRKFRNHIAHMDERFEEWFKTSENHRISRHDVTNRSEIASLNDKEILSLYIYDETTYIFRGDRLNLREVESNLIKMVPRSKILSNMPWWDDEFRAIFS